MKTATDKAILHLRGLLGRRFGKQNDTGCGADTLTIAHDRVELTDDECTIVQRGPARVARVLRRKRRVRTI